MKKKKKSVKKIITISIICIILLGAASYFIFGNSIRNPNFHFNSSNRGGNFQPPQTSLSDEEKANVTSFFENFPSSTEVDAYCKEYKPYCFYYCIEMRGDNEFCKELMNNTQMSSRGELPQ
jgi:hypothetical protein